MLSSTDKQEKDIWGTPIEFFNKLKNEFPIILDAATTEENPLGTKFFYTEKNNGLKQDWLSWTFCNPPYSKSFKFVQKAYYEHKLRGISSVLLLPAVTDVLWYHKYVWNRFKNKPYDGTEIRFYKGRLKFNKFNNPALKEPAPFASILVIFNGKGD